MIGTIAATGSNTALVAQIAPSSPATGSLGNICETVLGFLDTATSLVVLFVARTVSNAATLTGGTVISTANITPVGVPPSLKTLSELRSSLTVGSGMASFVAGSLTDTVPGTSILGGLLAAILDPSEVTMSIRQLVDALDAQFQKLVSPPAEMSLYFDQASGALQISTYSAAPTVTGADATATQTVTTASGAIIGG